LPRALAWGVFIWIAVVWGVRGAAGFAADDAFEQHEALRHRVELQHR
jgi:hypothetical protein